MGKTEYELFLKTQFDKIKRLLDDEEIFTSSLAMSEVIELLKMQNDIAERLYHLSNE